MSKILLHQTAIDGIKRRIAAHRITEHGDPLSRDKGLLRHVAQHGVGVARLIDKGPAAGCGESPWAEASTISAT